MSIEQDLQSQGNVFEHYMYAGAAIVPAVRLFLRCVDSGCSPAEAGRSFYVKI